MTPDEGLTFDARISAKVREIRLLRRLTQADVAAMIGIEADNFKRYEQGGRPSGWPVRMLADVADVLEVPLSALVPGERVVCDVCGSAKGRLAHARISAPRH